ncbi:MAG: hypothetical protein M3P18_15055, partial [Actinomycetota bacterium]|nr:hypothetical protein [Actinomycetota bacterium]
MPSASRSYVGRISARKASGSIFYRSRHEHDALIHMVFDHAVLRIERNDLTPVEENSFGLLRRSDPNRVFTLESGRYTPDIRVRLGDGSIIFVEVGAHSDKTEEHEARRLAEADIEIEKSGARFVLLTDRNMRGFLLENRKKLFPYLRPIAPTGDLTTAARRLLEASDHGLSVGELIEAVCRAEPNSSAASASEAIWSVVAEAEASGELRYDHAERIDVGTKVAI